MMTHTVRVVPGRGVFYRPKPSGEITLPRAFLFAQRCAARAFTHSLKRGPSPGQDGAGFSWFRHLGVWEIDPMLFARRPSVIAPALMATRPSVIFVRRLPVILLMLVVAFASGGVLGSSKQRGDLIPALNSPENHSYLDYVGMRTKQMKGYIVGRYQCTFTGTRSTTTSRRIVVTNPKTMNVTITQQFVCQIHSKQHIDVCALDSGYLEGSHQGGTGGEAGRCDVQTVVSSLHQVRRRDGRSQASSSSSTSTPKVGHFKSCLRG